MQRLTEAKEQEQSRMRRGEPSTKASGQGKPALVADRASTISAAPKGGTRLDAPRNRETGSPHIPRHADWLGGQGTTLGPLNSYQSNGRISFLGTVEGGDLD